MWNVYSTILDGGHRTNNHLEAWNRRLGSIVGHIRPTLWKAIDALRSEEATVTMKMAQCRVSALPKKRNKPALMALQQRVHNLCEDYTAGTPKIEDFRGLLDIRFSFSFVLFRTQGGRNYAYVE
ncbi:hypothetical protein HPB49_022594 [Dermacentor silvarum]|uniref:Uncharacterized protein n=1 Tax=Dermacentor silvarum TaxID=543639 RepID=A0ACB8D0I1_DERSI|nr:hypothetical protein HPB49_022594 [Dermacentor silvarum]